MEWTCFDGIDVLHATWFFLTFLRGNTPTTTYAAFEQLFGIHRHSVRVCHRNGIRARERCVYRRPETDVFVSDEAV